MESELNFSFNFTNVVVSRRALSPDLARGAWAPWPTDPRCRNLTVHFTHAVPPRALASFPGSGNTWARYLVEGATGIHTGSVYLDEELSVKGYRGEKEAWNSGTTILQKTHEYQDQTISLFKGRVVLIIRNPYRAILSYHNFNAGGHRGHGSVTDYRRREWIMFMRMQLRRWLLTALQWLTKGSDVQVLHYELLQHNLTAALTSLVTTLGLPADTHRLQCLEKYNSGSFQREQQFFPADVKIFPSDLRRLVDRAILYVNNLLMKRKLPLMPIHLYEFYNGSVPQSIIRHTCQTNLSQTQCDALIDDMNRTRAFQHPFILSAHDYLNDLINGVGRDHLQGIKLSAPVEDLFTSAPEFEVNSQLR
ncbi:WSC domain-containing protein 2-like [Hyalella azteca]|uniref:WSC domain-containing protein 2-like n=1 Tax=Hyalella azteca TaxID=294128 RepID=A0A979FQ25_HYAAZ|nr:WSC domain-containing protein 2-like [Hyalella azteca]